ncbi:hypothetical protein GCM10008111_26930 [Alishewanella tabrizica]|uniref:Uncharacterized protein n=1 Tax=Alishewanella tabrizica TaxID=671278 RepID=A0ABQ2WR71_9ALTE|nr:hypothetical protein GCM10008111_26930 [Alishewanella tabrizica]
MLALLFALLAPVGGVNATSINNAFLQTLTLCVCQHKQESLISTAEKNKPARGGLVDSVSHPEGLYPFDPRFWLKSVKISVDKFNLVFFAVGYYFTVS